MTVLDKFIAFASALPANQRESVEEALAALMESFSAEFAFTPAELTELEGRMADSKSGILRSRRYNQAFRQATPHMMKVSFRRQAEAGDF